MNAFSKIDMDEVTRLTQAGKLAEAMALLQGHSGSGFTRGSPRSTPHPFQGIMRQLPLLPTIDTVAPSVPSGAWTAQTQFMQRVAGESVQTAKAAGSPDLAQTMLALRHRLPKLGSLSNLGEATDAGTRAGRGSVRGADLLERRRKSDL